MVVGVDVSSSALAMEIVAAGPFAELRGSRVSGELRHIGSTGKSRIHEQKVETHYLHSDHASSATMALAIRNLPVAHFLEPLLNAPLRSPIAPQVLRRIPNQALPSFKITIPVSPIIAVAGISSGLQKLWESLRDGILKAVPKKKTSHAKKRHRQMANGTGKLKDVTALNKCSACGRPKMAHLLCPYCVNGWCT